jgi:hypothetical protein
MPKCALTLSLHVAMVLHALHQGLLKSMNSLVSFKDLGMVIEGSFLAKCSEHTSFLAACFHKHLSVRAIPYDSWLCSKFNVPPQKQPDFPMILVGFFFHPHSAASEHLSA